MGLAQDLFEWYEYYLKGNGPKPDFVAQVQRNDGQWRIEKTWPPENLSWLIIPLSECATPGAFVGGGAPVVGGGQTVTTSCTSLSEENDIKIINSKLSNEQFVAKAPEAVIFAELRDSQTGLRIGHATMDIRYHAGGYEPQTVLPSQQLTMMMEFQAIDAILPAGHGVDIIFTETGEDYLAPACGTSCSIHILPSLSTLSMPHIYRNGSNVLNTPQSLDAVNN